MPVAYASSINASLMKWYRLKIPVKGVERGGIQQAFFSPI